MLGLIGIGVLILTGCKDTGMDVSGDGSQVTVNHNGSLWVADIEKEN